MRNFFAVILFSRKGAYNATNTTKYKRINKYFRNRKHKDDSVKNADIKKITEYNWNVVDKNNYFNLIKINSDYKLYSDRLYISNIRKFCKKNTNKIVRKSNAINNFNDYRKLFDYANTIF